MTRYTYVKVYEQAAGFRPGRQHDHVQTFAPRTPQNCEIVLSGSSVGERGNQRGRRGHRIGLFPRGNPMRAHDNIRYEVHGRSISRLPCAPPQSKLPRVWHRASFLQCIELGAICRNRPTAEMQARNCLGGQERGLQRTYEEGRRCYR